MAMDFNVNVNVKTNGETAINNLEKKINAIKKEKLNLKVSVDKTELNKFKSSSKNIKYKITADTSGLKKANSEMSNLKKSSGSLKVKATVDSSGIKQAAKDFQMVKNLANQISKTKIKIAGLDPTKNANQISVLQKQLRSMESDYKILSKTLSGSFNKTQLGTLENIFGKTEDEVARINAKMKDLASTASKTGKSFTEMDAFTASNKTLTWLKNNSKAAKDYGDKLKYLAEQQRITTDPATAASLQKQVNAIKTEAASLGKTGSSLFVESKRAFSKILQFATMYGAIQRVVYDVPRQMVQAVLDVDKAMTNLYKVTDETTAKYDEFLSKSGEAAKSLGRDVSSYIEQSATWAKLGYNIDQSAELAKVSSIYANVGEVNDETAVSDLVTVMKAYNMNDSQAISIVDMLNELGNNYATDAASLGDGLKNMASTMAMSNTSLEKSLAILTGGSEITQDSGELGNAIKVAVLRMRGQKGALEDIGEYADDVESVSKMQTQILNMTKGAVNIMDSADPTSFRDYYDVMEDIAEVLPTLKETDQADLIETLFGKNRANQGQAILQAFQSGQIQKAYETALNSAGSAQKEQDKWLESAEAKLQQFKATFQELSTTVINSNFLKEVVDGGSNILSTLDSIIEKFGMIPTLLTAISAGMSFKNVGRVKRFPLLNMPTATFVLYSKNIVLMLTFAKYAIESRAELTAVCKYA